jgi:hypothetical protein
MPTPVHQHHPQSFVSDSYLAQQQQGNAPSSSFGMRSGGGSCGGSRSGVGARRGFLSFDSTDSSDFLGLMGQHQNHDPTGAAGGVGSGAPPPPAPGMGMSRSVLGRSNSVGPDGTILGRDGLPAAPPPNGLLFGGAPASGSFAGMMMAANNMGPNGGRGGIGGGPVGVCGPSRVMVLPGEIPSRKALEFEELGEVGRGEFGSVSCCRKRTDGVIYAVKRQVSCVSPPSCWIIF